MVNVFMLELMRQEQTNRSIAWKIEIYNSYIVNISTKKVNSEKSGLKFDNPCRRPFLSFGVIECSLKVNDRHFWNPK